MNDEPIAISVELTDIEAWNLAQFLKRVGFSDFRNLNAQDEDEAYVMQQAAARLRTALAQAGYEPR
jgi:hypothetical protein